MRQPNWITNNLGTIVTVGLALLAGYAGYIRLEGRVENLDAYRQERARQVDGRLAEIARSVEPMPNLAYRITAQEEALKATNDRVDNSLSNISARLAEINQGLGSLSTQVAVLTQRFEQAQPQRRAEAK